jgi:hypothetical protein
MNWIEARYRSKLTAVKRKRISLPTRFLLKHGLLRKQGLDYGCGYGFDARYLGYDKYDPNFKWSYLPEKTYWTIICHYVLNVIPEAKDREWILQDIKGYLRPGGKAFITVRRDKKRLNGWTNKGTYQSLVKLDLPILHETNDFCIYILQ